MLCLTHVAQPVCRKHEVQQKPLCFVPFLKLHTKLLFVIFITCNSLQSYHDHLFWPVCLEMLETKPVKGNFVKEPVKTFYVKKTVKVLFSGIMKTQIVYKFIFWHKKGNHL